MVAITRSLVQDTPIIVMDEPMSARDMGKQVDLLRVLLELVAEEKTVVLTTHNPNHALSIKCNACFLKQGTLIAHGDNSIITEELLRNIYGNNVSLDYGEKQKFVVFDTNTYKDQY